MKRAWHEHSDMQIAVAVGVILVCATLALGLTQAWLEARAFNKLAGEHVTTWDALWVELRVQR